MELKGKLVKILPIQSGEGKNGTWKKQEFIVETSGQFPKKVCFNLWGDKVEQLSNTENKDVTVLFDLESREFNGRWYTEAKAWKVDAGSEFNQDNQPDFPDENQDTGSDELPF